MQTASPLIMSPPDTPSLTPLRDLLPSGQHNISSTSTSSLSSIPSAEGGRDAGESSDGGSYKNPATKRRRTTSVSADTGSTAAPDSRCASPQAFLTRCAPHLNSPNIIRHCFSGTLCSTLTCLECRNKSEKVERFVDLSVSLKQIQQERNTGDVVRIASHSTLLQCLQEFNQIETLTDAMECGKCQRKVPGEKQLSVKQPPEVLVIQLKRFNALLQKKIAGLISFPLRGLDITSLLQQNQPQSQVQQPPEEPGNECSGARDAGDGSADDSAPTPTSTCSSASTSAATGETTSQPSPSSTAGSGSNGSASASGSGSAHGPAPPRDSACYDLSAIICHQGTLESGHYIAYVRRLIRSSKAGASSSGSCGGGAAAVAAAASGIAAVSSAGGSNGRSRSTDATTAGSDDSTVASDSADDRDDSHARHTDGCKQDPKGPNTPSSSQRNGTQREPGGQSPGDCSAQYEWIKCDDEKICVVPEETVREVEGYIFFYIRRETI